MFGLFSRSNNKFNICIWLCARSKLLYICICLNSSSNNVLCQCICLHWRSQIVPRYLFVHTTKNNIVQMCLFVFKVKQNMVHGCFCLDFFSAKKWALHACNVKACVQDNEASMAGILSTLSVVPSLFFLPSFSLSLFLSPLSLSLSLSRARALSLQSCNGETPHPLNHFM